MLAPTSFRFEVQDRVGVITLTRPDLVVSYFLMLRKIGGLKGCVRLILEDDDGW